MPSKQDEISGDLLIQGNLEVIGKINDSGMSEVLAAAEQTNAVAEVLTSHLDDVTIDVTSILSDLADLESDSSITPVEKLIAKPIWDNIVVEGTATTGTIPVQAALFGVADTDFDAAYAALDAYLNVGLGVFADMTATTVIVRVTWDATWNAYFAARTVLLDSIAEASKDRLDDIAADGKITPVEKLTAKQLWDAIVVEGTATTGTLPAQATLYGVADTDFDTAYAALDLYLNTTISVFADMTATTDITRAAWDTAWKNYYDARTVLLNDISDAVKDRIDDMDSDSWLTPAEKLVVQREWDIVAGEYAGVLAQAATWGIGATFTAYSDYTTAYTALDTFLNAGSDPLGDLTVSTAIVGGTLRSTFAAYFTKKEVLLNLLAQMTVFVAPGDTNQVLYLPLNDTTDDFSGKAHNGTLTAGTGGYEVGAVGRAFHFDGAASVITIADHADFDFGTGDFTVSFRAYLDNAPGGTETLYVKTKAGEGLIKIYTQADRDLVALIGTAASYTTLNAGAAALTAATWYHIVIARISGVVSLYLNAILMDSATGQNGSVSTSDSLYIGSAGASEWFDGLIDEVRVFNVGAAQSAVSFLYRNPSGVQMTAPVPKDPGKENLVAYYSLDEIEGTHVTDSSGNSHHGTLTKGAGDWADGLVGNAFHFDGADSLITIPDHTDLDFGTGDFGISFQVYHDNAGAGDEMIFAHRTATSDGHTAYITSANLLAWNAGSSAIVSGALAAAGWHHAIITRNGTVVNLYIDGRLAATATSSANITVAADFLIGDDYDSSNPFDGLIDELRAYNKALTPENVLFLHRNPGGSPKGLVTRNDVAVGELNAKHLLFGGYRSLITNTELWDEANGELFTLGFDLISDGGRSPVQKLVHKEPAILRTSDEVEYDNPRAKLWDGLDDDPRTDTIGIYKATTNTVPYPEDVTNAEWVKANCTASILEETFDGVPWQRVLCSNTSEASIKDTYTFPATTVSVRCVIRKGAAQTGTTRLRLYDATVPTGGAAGYTEAVITWSGSVAVNASGTGISVVEVDEDWILAGTIVSISFISIGLSAGEADTYIAFYPDETEAAGRYADFCMIQVEDSPYPTPYCFDTRPAGVLEYRKNLKDEGAIGCWVRPRFTYNDTGVHVVWSWFNSVGKYFLLYYHPGLDEFVAIYRWGGTARFLYQNVNYTNTTLWNWIHIKVVWDFSAGTGEMRVNGAQVASAWDGAPYAYDGTGWSFFIGTQDGLTLHFDGEITDLPVHIAEDATDTHYTADKPWMGQYDVPNYDQSVVITRKALKLTRAELSVIDKKNRSIDVGTQGILARDRVGNIIHDVSDGQILSDMTYMGHIYFKQTGSHVDNLSTTIINGVATSADDVSAVQNFDLSTELPAGVDNPHGLYASILSSITIAYVKITPPMDWSLGVYACHEYNTVPASYEWLNYIYEKGVYPAAGGYTRSIRTVGMLPIIWDSGTPYVSWLQRWDIGNANGASGVISGQSSIHILGFLV